MYLSISKFSNSKFKMSDSPDSGGRASPDMYSTVIVDDLLHGVNEWRNIQDIVRLTFKALSDVVRQQGASIRELER
jgi:hypothetical protein